MLIQNWRQFADITIAVHDLDPTYDFLYQASMVYGEDWSDRFMLHYLMFYNLGGAARAANGSTDDSFWDYVTNGYHLFKRGTERRHFRGELGSKAIGNLRKHGPPSEIIRDMYAPTYTELIKLFQTKFAGCGFGPYFIWKLMDLQDRVYGRPIRLNKDEALKYMPDEPRKCAATLWPHKALSSSLTDVTAFILNLPYKAPGMPNRQCGYAEAETVLCMLKGFFITRTHTIGDDVASKHKQLADFPDLLALLPPNQDWSCYERPEALDTATVSD